MGPVLDWSGREFLGRNSSAVAAVEPSSRAFVISGSSASSNLTVLMGRALVQEPRQSCANDRPRHGFDYRLCARSTGPTGAPPGSKPRPASVSVRWSARAPPPRHGATGRESRRSQPSARIVAVRAVPAGVRGTRTVRYAGRPSRGSRAGARASGRGSRGATRGATGTRRRDARPRAQPSLRCRAGAR